MRVAEHSLSKLSMIAFTGALAILSSSSCRTASAESPQQDSAETALAELSRLNIRLTDGRGSVADRFMCELTCSSPPTDSLPRQTLRYFVERDGDHISTMVEYPEKTVYAVLRDNVFYFPSREQDELRVSEGRGFQLQMPKSNGAFSFSFSPPPPAVDVAADDPRLKSRISIDLSELCGMLSKSGGEINWSAEGREIVLTKAGREARLVVERDRADAQLIIKSLTWEARGGSTFAVRYIRVGESAEFRIPRLDLVRIRERGIPVSPEALTVPQLLQYWSRMVTGDELTGPQSRMGKRLFEIWESTSPEPDKSSRSTPIHQESSPVGQGPRILP